MLLITVFDDAELLVRSGFYEITGLDAVITGCSLQLGVAVIKGTAPRRVPVIIFQTGTTKAGFLRFRIQRME